MDWYICMLVQAGPGPPNHGNINGASFDHDLPRQKAPCEDAKILVHGLLTDSFLWQAPTEARAGANGLWLFPQIGQARETKVPGSECAPNAAGDGRKSYWHFRALAQGCTRSHDLNNGS